MFEILSDNIDKFISLAILIHMSIFFRLVLQFFGQKWITTTSHTTTLVLLPIITYIITKVISGNIALSLGMVGALSIIRFRNPVRSPLELSVYFGAITMGISAAVSTKYLLFFGFAITIAIFVLFLINLITNLFLKKTFFTTSFTEGNALSTLEVKSLKEITFLENCNELNLKKFSKNGVEYILNSNNFDTLKNIQRRINKNKEIISYQLNK